MEAQSTIRLSSEPGKDGTLKDTAIMSIFKVHNLLTVGGFLTTEDWNNCMEEPQHWRLNTIPSFNGCGTGEEISPIDYYTTLNIFILFLSSFNIHYSILTHH